MESEDDINDELKDIAPGFPRRKSMDAPPGYFETFPDQVLNRWRKEESQPLLRKIFFRRVVGIAAVLAGLCIGSWWLLRIPSPIRTNDITATEAYQYIHENIAEFETLIETDNIQMVENQIDVSPEVIEEYLIEEMHGSDPEDLF